MFNLKNHKLELRVKKVTDTDDMVDVTPSITKEEILAVGKQLVKYVVGGALIVLAGSAALDTAKYGAMTAIENRSSKDD